jgi:hypothetical protein
MMFKKHFGVMMLVTDIASDLPTDYSSPHGNRTIIMI